MSAPAPAAAPPARWAVAKTVQLEGLDVSVSEPVLVARSKGYLWFPTLVRRADGQLLAVMSNKADTHTEEQTGVIARSSDGGLTWAAAEPVPLYSECPVELDDGVLLLPNYLFPQQGGGADTIGGAHLFWPKNGDKPEHVKEPVTVTGWPREPAHLGEHMGRPDLNIAGFLFNGETVRLDDGGGNTRHLATLYGYFKGDNRYSLVVAELADGRKWTYRSTVAGADCKLQGAEGPCEAALCRLKDGRLMCVFRLASAVPYGRSYSDDEGKTWTEPANIEPFSVQPSLAVVSDGLVALSGGRPGVSVWFDVEGKGERWQAVELFPADAKTSAYTEVVAVDDSTLLCIYDRVPHGWAAIPESSPEFNSVWVVRLTLKRTP
jgi:hypothetical protein